MNRHRSLTHVWHVLCSLLIFHIKPVYTGGPLISKMSGGTLRPKSHTPSLIIMSNIKQNIQRHVYQYSKLDTPEMWKCVVKVESYLETERQVARCLSVSAVQDASPEQTGHCLVCQQPSYHTDSYSIRYTPCDLAIKPNAIIYTHRDTTVSWPPHRSTWVSRLLPQLKILRLCPCIWTREKMLE